jgi:arylformamidase
MTQIIDISVTISNQLAVWPGDPVVKLERISRIEDGEVANVSQISMSVHTGTHIDAPYHFISNGKTIENLPLDVLIGPVQVVQLDDNVAVITGPIIRECGIGTGVERVIFKTRNSQFWPSRLDTFHTDFTAIDADGARQLILAGIRLVGIDYLSIAPYKLSRPTHEVLLGSSVIILEGCDLSHVSPGMYTLYALPTKFGGSDGAPVRAVLVS